MFVLLTINHMSPKDKSQILSIAERYGARNIRVFGSVAGGEDLPF